VQLTAAVVRGAGQPFTIEPLTADDLQPDEIAVRIAAVGICHTDLAVQHGHIPVPLPAVLGHEGAGTVESVGAGVASVHPGDRVILSQALCGHCAQCLGGEPAYCEHAARLSLGGRREDGTPTLWAADTPVSGNFVGQSSFATHAIVKERNAYPVAGDVPFEVLAPLGCGVMTGAGAVFNDARLEAGSSVAVFGCGTVGLAAVMAAKVAGAAIIIAVDLHAARLEIARRLGATYVVAGGSDVTAQVQDRAGDGVDVAIEAAGVPALAAAAVASTHRRGRTVIVGAAPFGSALELDWWTLAAGRRVQGSVIGSSDPGRDLARLVELWRAGKLPVGELITTFPFDRINDAVTAMAAGDVIKPVLVMEGVPA
jgi:aryl-alcohol dehydrogenase